MTEKKTGEYQLGCGHVVDQALDTQARIRCPICAKDTIVTKVLR